jgi:transcription termination factor Rho
MSKISNKFENYFPQGLDEGEAFCNRLAERKRLATNIRANQHTLLMAPRRYGKTSLVNYVAKEIDMPFSEVDLFVAIDAERIEQQVLKGIKEIIGMVSTSVQNAVKLLSDYFKNYTYRH